MSGLKVQTTKTEAIGFGVDDIDSPEPATYRYAELFKMEEVDTHPHDVQTLLPEALSAHYRSTHEAIYSIAVMALGAHSQRPLPSQHYYAGAFQMTWRPARAGGREHLRDALAELDGVLAEAREEGFEEPSDDAAQNAGKLLRAMYSWRPSHYEVYPTREREVAIYTPGARRRSVLVLCESTGGVMCLVNLDGQYRHTICSSADMLPESPSDR